MKVTLDGQALFDEQQLRLDVGTRSRASLERAVCGLDGVISIDLGARTREVRQTGTLHAPSRKAMRARIDSICAFIDGGAHTLKAADGVEYHNVRMDTFKPIDERVGGAGVVVEYAVTYTQLGA